MSIFTKELLSLLRQEKVMSFVYPYNGSHQIFLNLHTSEGYAYNIYQLMHDMKILASKNGYYIRSEILWNKSTATLFNMKEDYMIEFEEADTEIEAVIKVFNYIEINK